jgi:hypothetical protein
MAACFKDTIATLEKDKEWLADDKKMRKRILDNLRAQKELLEDEIDQHIRGKS